MKAIIVVISLIISCFLLCAQSDVVFTLVDTNSVYIDYIMEDDGYYFIDDNGIESKVKEGLFFIRFFGNYKFFFSDLLLGEFPDNELFNRTDIGNKGTFKYNKNKIIIEFENKSVEPYRNHKYVISINENQIIFEKYKRGLFWQKIKIKNRYKYIKYSNVELFSRPDW